MKIVRFEELECWKEARKLVNMIYETISKSEKFKRDFRLRDQATAAAVSTMSNIAEGFSRKSNKEFIQFLYISKASASEVQSIFYVALDQEHCSKEESNKIYSQADKVSRIISGLIKYLSSKPHNPITLKPYNPITQQPNNLLILILIFIFLFHSSVYAADKNWVGAGDASTWADGKNWHPAAAPTSVDNVVIGLKDAYAIAAKTFEAKSLYVGGPAKSTFATNDFIYGNIIPDSASDHALYIRKAGTAVLKGEGTIKLKGIFKNSEETLTGEESFMFTIK